MQSCRLRRLHSQSAPLSPRAWAQQCRPYRQSRRPSGECSAHSAQGGHTGGEAAPWQTCIDVQPFSSGSGAAQGCRLRRPCCQKSHTVHGVHSQFFLYSSLATNY